MPEEYGLILKAELKPAGKDIIFYIAGKSI
jgi:hypothetical protein